MHMDVLLHFLPVDPSKMLLAGPLSDASAAKVAGQLSQSWPRYM